MTYDQFITALAVWREARGECREARRGVYHVIANRMRLRNKTAVQVCLEPKQFSCFLAGDPNATRLPNPAHPADWQAWQDIAQLVQDEETQQCPDPTGRATHYLSPLPKPPSWADPSKITAKLGNLTFYRL